MATNIDFSVNKWEDATITIAISPATNIGTWDFDFTVMNRFGGTSGLINKVSSSGYGGGQSGITITNSGQGTLNVRINSPDTSGLCTGLYAFSLERTNSGSRTVVTYGYMKLLPAIGP